MRWKNIWGWGLCLCGGMAMGAEVELADHGQALLNPGMGWTMHFYSNLTENYGSKLPPAETLDWFEGCSTVYLRLPWAFIEPEEGNFQWSVVDTPAQRWIAKGKKVAFRFTTSEHWMEYATPKWVEEAGAKMVRYTYGDGVSPDGAVVDPIFDDPIFLEKLNRFLAEAGKRYNGNPDVAFIDVGTFGLWGEGHTVATQKLPDAENVRLAKMHIDLHKKYFPDTQLVISDDVIGPEAAGKDFPLMQYCRERGVSLRDDSILVQPVPRGWFHADLSQNFWPHWPVVLEHQHYGASLEVGAWDGTALLESVEAYHASYMSIHWWPEILWDKEKETIRAINRRMGYRFIMPKIEYPDQIVVGQPFEIVASVGNAGVAPCYFDAYLCYTLTDQQGGIAAVLTDESLNLRNLPVGPADAVPLQEQRSQCVINAIAPRVAPGEYDLWLSVGRLDGTPLVALPYSGSGADKRVPLGKMKVGVDTLSQ